MVCVSKLNLEGVSSELIDSLKENDENINVSLPEQFDSIIEDFNSRNINLSNLVDLIKLCAFIQINNIVKFLLDNMQPTFEKIVNKEDIEILKFHNFPEFLYNRKSKINECFSQSVQYGLFSWMLFFDPEKKFWDSFATRIACKHNNFDMLKYFVSNDCPLGSECIEMCILNNNLEMMIYLCENECEINQLNVLYAAKRGNLNFLKWFTEHDFRCSHVCETCVKYNHLECLKYAVSQKYELIDTLTSTAVEYNRLEILKYLHENNCKLDKMTVQIAACNGNLECLEYVHKNGCSLDCMSFFNCILSGELDCVKYLYENSCPTVPKDKDEYGKYMYKTARKIGNEECREYLSSIEAKGWENMY
jgi:hypothetical protein